jgi:hypothetical protein
MTDGRVAFLIAGVQKAGTTALFEHLQGEPELSLPAVKEAHFFDDETQDWGTPDYGAYHARFVPFDGRPRGEATPIYLYWPQSLARIRRYNPAMKLIVLLRDPVERAWSHWKMEYARGAEARPFAWCIRQGRQRLFDADPWGFHREFSYVERGFYGEQMARLFDLFPRGQVLTLTAGDLRHEATRTLGRVRGFLGLRNAAPAAAREAHVARDIDYGEGLSAADAAHLNRIYARDQDRLAELVGLRFPIERG